MRLGLLAILAAAACPPCARGVLLHVRVDEASYAGSVGISEPALLAVVGVTLIGISKLFRK